MTESDIAVASEKPPFDVCIYITNVDGTLEFEGHVNPDKPLEAIDQCALQFTSFVAAQLPMLMQMAATAAQPSRLLDADGVQIES